MKKIKGNGEMVLVKWHDAKFFPGTHSDFVLTPTFGV